ncbi:hypothetical protein C6Y01_16100 [Bacillus sp. NMCC46]|nr:hypothetical protein CHI05_13965 [Bacillus sp. 7788]PRS39421.1 hypothetical protein C6Y01_16100 [Bacillus sp. NMCC46]
MSKLWVRSVNDRNKSIQVALPMTHMRAFSKVRKKQRSRITAGESLLMLYTYRRKTSWIF